MIDLETDILKQVAIKHSVLLGKDDPILVTVTLNEMVLARYLELAAAQYADANRALTISLQQQVDQSKETAGRVITAAADYVAKEVQLAVTSAITDARHAGQDAAANNRDARAAKNGAFLAAVVAGASALIAVVALVVVLVK